MALALKVDILQHQLKTLENSGESSQENKNNVDHCKRLQFIICYKLNKYSFLVNKDDNFKKGEALKRFDKRTLTLGECQN